MSREAGWYRLPSGEVVHAQWGRSPSTEDLEALDELVAAVHRRYEWEKLEAVRQLHSQLVEIGLREVFETHGIAP